MTFGRPRSWTLARPLLAARAALALGAFGCGSDTGPTSVAAGGGSFSASIDGSAWTADVSNAEARHAQPGKYVLSGTKITGTSSLGLEIDLYNIAGPGTYPLGVGDKVFGGIGWVIAAEPPTYWLTPNSGASGTVTIATLTSSRIAGSFSYNAPAYTVIGNATGTRAVTNGTFDLPIRITGTVGAVATNAGGKMSAVIGGSPWNAANVNVTTGNALKIAGDNSSYLVGINLTSVTGPGSYALAMSPARILTVSGPSTNPTGLNCCWGGWVNVADTVATLADVGSVNITQFGNGRIVGTFGAVLAGIPNTLAKGQLVIANGSFDLGIP